MVSNMSLISYDPHSFNDSSPSNKFSNDDRYSKELFSKYDENDSLEKYLISTKNAQSDEEDIKELSNNITKNRNTTWSKAEAIFDWVKENISYSNYGDTKYGGAGTIKIRKGNCVDTSHALVSLLRANNIPARYVSGKCEFIEGDLAGSTTSHVWVQVLIDGEWVVVDGTYEGNRLGYVINWKTDSYKLYKFYSNI